MLLLAALLVHQTSLASGQSEPGLVVDVRIVEARSTTPDYKAMEELSFFIDTDGTDVSEHQWLATIARTVQDSFLATLAFETLPVRSSSAALTLDRRSRHFEISLALDNFVEEDVFPATVSGRLLRGDRAERAFDQDIELQVGRTYVWSGAGLEFSASEYLSHFRDYANRENREELYAQLREFTTFLLFAVTLRRDDELPSSDPPITLTLSPETKLPDLHSPLGVDLVGTIELELDVDGEGAPQRVRIVRSSLPEVNPRLIGEAESWRFPNAFGKTGRLTLTLEAQP